MSIKMEFNNDFDKIYGYNGELGAIYNKDRCKFILWAPTATNVQIALYGDDGYKYNCDAKEVYSMSKGSNGTWIIELNGDLNGKYYNYLVNVDGKINEVVDPYANR